MECIIIQIKEITRMFILDYREKQNEQRTEPINIYLTMLTGFFS